MIWLPENNLFGRLIYVQSMDIIILPAHHYLDLPRADPVYYRPLGRLLAYLAQQTQSLSWIQLTVTLPQLLRDKIIPPTISLR